MVWFMGNTRSEGWETDWISFFSTLLTTFSDFGHNKEPRVQTNHLYLNVSRERKVSTWSPPSSPLVLSQSVNGHVNLQKQWKVLWQICMHNELHMARRIWFPKKLARARTHSPVLTPEIKVILSLWHTRKHTFNFICPFALYSVYIVFIYTSVHTPIRPQNWKKRWAQFQKTVTTLIIHIFIFPDRVELTVMHH